MISKCYGKVKHTLQMMMCRMVNGKFSEVRFQKLADGCEKE